MKKIDKRSSLGQSGPSKPQKRFNPYERGNTAEGGTHATYRNNRTSSRPLKVVSQDHSKKSSSVASNRTQKTKESSKPRLTKTKTLTQKQKIRLKKRRQRALIGRLMLMMLVTIGIVWGGVYLKEYFTKTTISTQVVQIGSIDTSTQLDGIIFRSEEVIYEDQGGNAQYVVAEGEKVKKDGMVYALVDEEKISTVIDQKENVENEIYHKAEKNEEIAGNQDERYNLDQAVKSKFEEYYNNCLENSTKYVYALRSQLDSSVSHRTDLYVKEESQDKELVNEKIALDKVLGNYQAGKSVDKSGIVSFHMDHYETVNAAEAINKMTYEQFNKLKKVTTSTQLGQNTLEKGSPVYKLVLDNAWYVMTYIDPREDVYTQGDTYKLSFEEMGDKTVTFTLSAKKEEKNKLALIFKTSDQISDFLSVRSVSFSIGDKAVKGLKIPVQSIVEQNYIKIPMACTVTDNETIGVYRKKGEAIEFVALDIQKTDKEAQCYFVLQDLTDAHKIRLNDLLVNEAEKTTYQVTESEVKQGVYVVNGKVASFKEIEVMAQSNAYAIVRNHHNSQLKEMDKIISNPKNVKMNELLDHMKIQNE